MRRAVVALCLVLAALAGPPPAAASPVTLAAEDRVLVLAPHPDDETLGCGGVIQRARALGAAVRVVFLTNGDANEVSFAVYRRHPVVEPGAVLRMGEIRHDEALAAGRALGLEPDRLTFLGYPDFGTLDIWMTHWGEEPPLRSLFTRVTAVPYANAYRRGAPYKGEDIVRDLTAIIRDFRPTLVFVSHPADMNSDHRALYLFTRVALWDLAKEVAPRLLPFLIHHPRWPPHRGLHDTEPLEPPGTLAAPVAWQRLPLTAAMRTRKQAALRAHDTQMRYSGNFLLSFVRANELFGDFPGLTLLPDAPAPGLAATENVAEPPEELTEAERAAFVGIEGRSFRREGDDLVVATRFARPLGDAVALTLYLFGHRDDRPFPAMPKLRVELGVLEHRVLDQGQALPRETVSVTRAPREITVRVSLATLGHPHRILTGARTSLADVPLGSMSWRVLDVDRP